MSALEDLVPDPAQLTTCFTGRLWLEGPCWLRDRGRVRFSDVKACLIYDFDPVTGETSVYRRDSDHVNGRTVDHDGSVLECSHGARSLLRDRDGEISPVVSHYGAVRLNAPNDVVVSSDGCIWFTDPAYGLIFPEEGHGGRREYADHFVFRVTPSGELRVAASDLVEPNGLAFSPDEKTLYIADSARITREGDGVLDRHHIRAYTVDGDRLKVGRDLASISPGVPDGIRVDELGNIWSSSEDAVIVLTPDGEEIGRVAVPEKIGNLCFGGEHGTTLFITATTSLYCLPTSVHDCRWASGRA